MKMTMMTMMMLMTMRIKMTMISQVQAVCNKLNLFIDDQQQLAETKTGPRYGFVIFSYFACFTDLKWNTQVSNIIKTGYYFIVH